MCSSTQSNAVRSDNNNDSKNLYRDIKSDYGKVFTLSVAALEGKEVKPELKQLSDALRINHSKLADICSSVSVLMW